MATNQQKLDKLKRAQQAGVDLSSPKAAVEHMLAEDDKQEVLWFYKPNSVEFDFDNYRKLVEQLVSRS